MAKGAPPEEELLRVAIAVRDRIRELELLLAEALRNAERLSAARKIGGLPE